MTDRLQANIAAAKMLGYRFFPYDMPGFDERGFKWNGECFADDAGAIVAHKDAPFEFNIFANTSDCLAAQQKLWERGLSVCSSPNGPENTIDYFIWDESNQTHFAGIQEQTPQDALGAACIEVMK